MKHAYEPTSALSNEAPVERKWPLRYVLLGVALFCGAFWIGMRYLLPALWTFVFG